MSDPVITESVTSTLSGASFSDGTEANGTFTANYNAEGDLVSVTNVDVAITGYYPPDPNHYDTTFLGATVTQNNGTYEITLTDPSSAPPSNPGAYGATLLAWDGEDPSTLDNASYVYTGPDLAYKQTLTSGGSILDQTFCFMAGTNILTPAGNVGVETLKIGDLVTLSDGRVVPVSWMGIQTVSTIFADKLRVLPIRIKAGALGDSMPARDLLISPDHAVLVGDILVQAGALVNGVSVVRETNVPATFIYYHVEVADHSLILAENLAAETFVDNVDRMGFDNWAEHEALYGAQETIAEMDYPRARSARQVPAAIRARLTTRAQALYGVDLATAA